MILRIRATKDEREICNDGFSYMSLNPGTRVFLRLDLNMPMMSHGDGIPPAPHAYAYTGTDHHTFTDLTRLHAARQTLIYALHAKAHVIVVTHLGRPTPGTYNATLTTQHLLPALRSVLDQNIPIFFAPTLESLHSISHEESGSLTLLENIRFWPEETKPTHTFTHALAQLCDVYVNDAFSVSHRQHTSVYALPHHMHALNKPCFMGFHMKEEVRNLNAVLSSKPSHRDDAYTLAFLGGSKVSTKIHVIHHMAHMCDYVFLGGGMANTFLIARGDMPESHSFFEADLIEDARSILKRYPHKIILPHDGISTDHIENPTRIHTVDFPVHDYSGPLNIVDIGPRTYTLMQSYIQKAHTILWNGPFGVIEYPPFDQGSSYLAHAIAQAKPHAHTVLGGGDTLLCIKDVSPDHFSYVSTAGGAFLAYLEHGTLPGVAILKNGDRL